VLDFFKEFANFRRFCIFCFVVVVAGGGGKVRSGPLEGGGWLVAD